MCVWWWQSVETQETKRRVSLVQVKQGVWSYRVSKENRKQSPRPINPAWVPALRYKMKGRKKQKSFKLNLFTAICSISVSLRFDQLVILTDMYFCTRVHRQNSNLLIQLNQWSNLPPVHWSEIVQSVAFNFNFRPSACLSDLLLSDDMEPYYHPDSTTCADMQS